MDNEQYFKKSWALLTRDKGWIKPLLVMTAANFVPIAGFLGTKGYTLEWARLTAWGVDSAPKQKNVNVGACIASGWRAFVVDLGWGLALSVVLSVVGFVVALVPLLGPLLGACVSLLSSVVSVFAGVVFLVAEIRASIYERIAAGYRYEHIYEMIRRDTRGLMRVFLVALACAGIMFVASLVMTLVIMIPLVPAIMAASTSSSNAAVMALMGSGVVVVVMCALLGLVLSFLATGVHMILATSVALWMRQFDVPSWGRNEDPLPGSNFSESRPSGPMQSSYEQGGDDPSTGVGTFVPSQVEQDLPDSSFGQPEAGRDARAANGAWHEPEPRSVDDLYEDLNNLLGDEDDPLS